uniref:HCLS1 binding protein 3 n=1 Tax=Pongo abelii TaxID=9601 RepID=A0A8I5UM96_PONAB
CQAPGGPAHTLRLQNAHTGLDLTVPQHQEVRGKMMSGHVEYQILVVTRLAAFKSAKHRPEDVVQFLVPDPQGLQGSPAEIPLSWMAQTVRRGMMKRLSTFLSSKTKWQKRVRPSRA